MPDFRFPKQHRLLQAREFQKVFDQCCSAADGLLILYGTTGDLGHPRLGLTVSRKVGNAVVRNRWKRALREAFRLTQSRLPPLDLVCIPKAHAKPNVRRLMESLQNLSRHLEGKMNKKHRSRQQSP